MIFKQDDWKRTQLRLPTDMHEKLSNYAEINGLSQNAAILQILEKVLNSDIAVSKLTIVESLKNIEMLLNSKDFQFDNGSLIASRLNECLKVTNEISNAKLTPSKVAEKMAEESSTKFTNYFSGASQPTFFELEEFANFFGVNSDWMKHGNLPKFNVKYDRLSTNPEEAIKEILNISLCEITDLSSQSSLRPTDIYLVRKDSEAGEFLIVRKFNDWVVDVIKTPIHVSDVIGSGGESMLKSLFVTLKFLYELYINSRLENCVFVKGYIVSPSEFSNLSEGIIHPLSILQNIPANTWWEDIWDASMYGKNEYWKGFQNIAAHIQKCVDSDKWLSEVSAKIKKHEFDLLKN